MIENRLRPNATKLNITDFPIVDTTIPTSPSLIILVYKKKMKT